MDAGDEVIIFAHGINSCNRAHMMNPGSFRHISTCSHGLFYLLPQFSLSFFLFSLSLRTILHLHPPIPPSHLAFPSLSLS